MEPSKWGSQAWTFLHAITYVYPENPTDSDKKTHYDFFMGLKNVIPCMKCRRHYEKHINELPIKFYLNSRDSLIDWLYKIHNKVNVSLGKPEFNKEDIPQLFEKSCVRNSYIAIIIILLGILSVAVFYCVYNRNKLKRLFTISN